MATTKKTVQKVDEIPEEVPAPDLSVILAGGQAEAEPEPEVEAEQNLGGLSQFPPNSDKLEALLSAGYGGMTRVQAEKIISERAQNPTLWPFEQWQKANAFLEALNARPAVIAKNKGWERS